MSVAGCSELVFGTDKAVLTLHTGRQSISFSGYLCSGKICSKDFECIFGGSGGDISINIYIYRYICIYNICVYIYIYAPVFGAYTGHSPPAIVQENGPGGSCLWVSALIHNPKP